MLVGHMHACSSRGRSLNFETDQCEAGLAFWLVEELLDTQTIDGCRIVFDYLESRRERMCAVGYNEGKDWKIN